MGKIPEHLRQTIAANIRACRLKKCPGRGGGKQCAALFSEFVGQNVSPQQWSPWERGMRTPDEVRLGQLAEFFGVTVEWLRRDHSRPPPDTLQPDSRLPPGAPPRFDGVAGLDFPPPPSWEPAPPGSAASFFWLVRHIAACAGKNGIRIDLHLDSQALGELVRILKPS